MTPVSPPGSPAGPTDDEAQLAALGYSGEFDRSMGLWANMALGFTYLVLALINVDIPWGNPTLVMLISLFSGVQLLSLGVMGEYVGRIYDEVKRRPMFIIESMEGFERGADAMPSEPTEAPEAWVRRL